VTGLRVANDEGSEIARARDIAVAGLDHDGTVSGRPARTARS
jgi:hypothetical protein